MFNAVTYALLFTRQSQIANPIGLWGKRSLLPERVSKKTHGLGQDGDVWPAGAPFETMRILGKLCEYGGGKSNPSQRRATTSHAPPPLCTIVCAEPHTATGGTLCPPARCGRPVLAATTAFSSFTTQPYF